MKKNLYLILFLFLFSAKSFASHVNGGDLSMRHSPVANNANRYEITFKLFRDINGIALNPNLTSTICQKSTNAIKLNVVLSLVSSSYLVYNNLDSVYFPTNVDEIQMGIYKGYATLNSSDYNSEIGYYIYLLESSRSMGVLNYLSDSDYAQFYMEFPSLALYPTYQSPVYTTDPNLLMINGVSFNTNYNATQQNGDSLSFESVYPLGEGLNGRDNNPISFNPGYNFFTNIMNSIPVSGEDIIEVKTGNISLTPLATGKYLLAFRVSHFDTAGTKIPVKIGEIRREFIYDVYVPKTVGINSTYAKNSFVSTYPNPVSEMVTLSYQLPIETRNAQVSIFDVMGRKVRIQNLMGIEGKTEISVSDLANGTYVYQVQSANTGVLAYGKLTVTK